MAPRSIQVPSTSKAHELLPSPSSESSLHTASFPSSTWQWSLAAARFWIAEFSESDVVPDLWSLLLFLLSTCSLESLSSLLPLSNCGALVEVSVVRAGAFCEGRPVAIPTLSEIARLKLWSG